MPVLTAGLALPLREDRLLSAEALGDFGPLATSASDALKKAATDEDKDVQEAAAKALKAVEQATAAPITRESRGFRIRTAQAGRLRIHGGGKVEIGVKGKPGEIVPEGTKLKVLEIRGSWIGVRIDGKDKTGWLRGEQLSATYSHTFIGK